MFALAKQFVKHAEGLLANLPEQTHTRPRHGWRVVHVTKTGPGDLLGLQSLFDYIVGIDDVPTEPPLSQDKIQVLSEEAPHSSLEQITAGKCRSLTVWSGKGQTYRKLEITSPAPLQVTVQWTPLDAAEHVWHVLDVQLDSPAHQAGLLPYSEYIVGGENGVLAAGGEDLLGRVVASTHANSPTGSLTLYVYNHDYDVVRPVVIQPRTGWGGHGLLGCNVGYGYLHQIPARPDRHSSLAPGEVLFGSQSQDSPYHAPDSQPPAQSESTNLPGASPDLFVPAAMGPNPKKPIKHKDRARARVQDYQDYFADETKRSSG